MSVKNFEAFVSDDTKIAMKKAEGIKSCNASKYDDQGGIWTAPLKYNEWKRGFVKLMSEMLNSFLPLPRLVSGREYECKLTAFEKNDGRIVLLVSNDEYYNACPKVAFGQKIKSARSLTKYDGYKTAVNGDVVTVGVAPRSMEMIEIEFE